ncbi:hypothetical protein BDN71DRAFT_539076 [Pleurotus eryngii]|uniref:Protein CPL1-like domain-containing protein n=1 Tax=Pleurotus eryngii TaxID=5323 RepID=A0A9P6A640_PLEER|nr:hypothetical protein BDN71DRAFT_539076 [Pleurotus eryngii]
MTSISFTSWLTCAVLIISFFTLAEVANCAPGTYLSGTACLQCEAGSYTKELNQRSCTKARAGYYIPNDGATAETPCTRGTYSATQGSTSCLSCPAGSMCPSDALANPQKCSPGRYSTGGAVECTWCSPGTFNSVQGATGCCACCAGWFNKNPSLTNCQKCSNQYLYCSPGATSCTAPMGQYAPVSSCSMNGRNCPLTFFDDASQAPIQRSEPGILTCHTSKERACPVYKIKNGVRTQVGYKCQFVVGDLWPCGGCPSDDSDVFSGEDCTEIPNVDSVECIKGQCVIRSCIYGHGSSANHTVCIPATSTAAAEGLVAQGLHAKSWHN